MKFRSNLLRPWIFRSLGLALALALLAGMRLPFLRCEPFVPGMPLLFDEKDYLRGAKALPAGDTTVDTNEAWIRAPGTAWLLMTVARVRGEPVELAACDYQRLQVGLWAVMLLLLASIAAMLFGWRSALATAFLVAILPIGAAVTLMVHADTPFMLAQVSAIWALLVYARRGHIAWLIAAGVLAGLAALVRSPIMPLLPVLALWAGYERWRRTRAESTARTPGALLNPATTPPNPTKDQGPKTKDGSRSPLVVRLWSLVARLAPLVSWRLVLPAALFVICVALVLAPWTIRNYRLYGGFIPSDTTGAVNLLDNNAPTGYPSFRAIRASSDNPVGRQQFATRQALAFIAADPLNFARKFVYASWLAWSPETFRRSWNFWTALLERTRPAALLAQLTVLYWPAIALAMLGLLFAPREAAGARGYRVVMLITVLYYTLTIGITHFEDRYRLPFLLLWLPYAGWCLAHPRAMVARLRRPAGALAVAVAVVLAISYVPMVWPIQGASAWALALHARGLLRERGGDLAGALADQQAAAALVPDLREAAVASARIEARTGDLPAAERSLRDVLGAVDQAKLRPPADAIVTLQQVLRAQGRLEESAALDGELTFRSRRRAEELAWQSSQSPAATLNLGKSDLGLVRGFYAVEQDRSFRWSGPQAQLLLAGPADHVCLNLNAARPAGIPAPVVALAARVDGQPAVDLGRLRPPRSGWAWMCTPLSRPSGASAQIEIDLRATGYNPFEHGAKDARDLGVAIREAALRSGPLTLDPATGLLLDASAAAAEARPDLQLIGMSGPLRGKPGQTVTVALWWRAAQAPPAGLFTFVHLVDASGQKVADYNAPLAGDTRPQPWIADEPLLDPAALPLPVGLAPGRYRLVAGAFDPASGTQLARADLGEFAVEAK